MRCVQSHVMPAVSSYTTAVPSLSFQCPHRNRLLQKSDPDYVAGEAGSFVSLGRWERTCPARGKFMDAIAIRKGTFDLKPAAGGKAMLALMATPDHAEYAHPLFWAPFVVVGEGGSNQLSKSQK